MEKNGEIDILKPIQACDLAIMLFFLVLSYSSWQ